MVGAGAARGAASVAHDRALPPGRRGPRRDRRRRVAPLLHDPRPGEPRLLRGARAAAPRAEGGGAREHRRAAPHPRPAGVPALAGHAAVGRGAVPAADRHRRPADRRLDRVARPPVRVRTAGGGVRRRRRLRHRVDAHEPLAPPARLAVAGDRRRPLHPRHRHAGAGAPARRLAALAPRSGRRSSSRSCPRTGSSRFRSTASRRRFLRASRRLRATSSPTSWSSTGATRSTRLQRAPPRPDVAACARSRIEGHNAAPTP